MDEPEKKKFALGIADTVSLVLAGTCAAFCVIAVVDAPDNWKKYVIYATFAISFAMSCLMGIQRIIIIKNPGIRDFINKIRSEINRMQDENNKLGDEITLLQMETKQLKETEEKLSKICENQGANVKALSLSVKENGELLEKIQDRLKAHALTDIMRVIFDADDDGSYTIEGDKEIEELILRLENQANVEFNKEKFRESLRSCNYSVKGAMDLARDVADDGNAVFTVKGKKPMSASDRASLRSSRLATRRSQQKRT